MFCHAPQVLAQQQVEAAVFDTSRLVDFTESVQYTIPAVQLTPLVREAGCMAVTDARLYFQPLHNVTGDSPVRAFALSDVAAMARRRSSLKPTGTLRAHDVWLRHPNAERVVSSICQLGQRRLWSPQCTSESVGSDCRRQ